VLSAPSGAGKTTLTAGLRREPDFIYSVSCTTRSPRPGEVDGRHYHFLKPEEFLARVAAGEFLEHAEVHGRHYGTLKSSVIAHLAEGRDVLVDVDTTGAAAIRASTDPVIKEALADIFLMPPGQDVLERRLRGRGTETEEQIAVRLRNAAAEMRHWKSYRYALLSGAAEEDVANFRAIMRAERQLARRLTIHSP